MLCFFFFFNDTATTEIYTRKDTLSLHDALPISTTPSRTSSARWAPWPAGGRSEEHTSELQSPFLISYAVFCLKKKKTKRTNYTMLMYSQIIKLQLKGTPY